MPSSDARAAVRAYVCLGSNLDDPQQQVQRAFAALADLPDTQLLRHSRLFRTEPWGNEDQPAFVNAVAELATALDARTLLDALLAVERTQGRRRDGERWGPRTLDLDLLTFGDARIDEPGLVVPHPRIAERAFVLVPLAELDAGLAIPGIGMVRDLLSHVDARGCIPIA